MNRDDYQSDEENNQPGRINSSNLTNKWIIIFKFSNCTQITG